MQFSNLLFKLYISDKIIFDINKNIKNISLNSKQIKKGDVFISLKGKKHNGNNFFNEAIQKGSNAIITDTWYKNKYKNKVPIIYDKYIKKKLPDLLNYFYQPLPKNIIAVTGTNGKSSVCWYVYQVLKLINSNASYIGTIGQYLNDKKISDLEITTPDICSLYRFANEHFKKGSNHLIFEASSHGLDQERLNGLPVNIAAMTNISHDHLDYHKNFTSYKEAKFKLFTKYLKNNGIAVINSQIKFSSNFKKELKSKSISLITYGNKNSSIFIEKLKGKYFIKIKNKKYKLPIIFNNIYDLRNFECSIAILLALKIDKSCIIENLDKIISPPGRMERCIKINNKSQVFVDFAHTPDALKNILISTKKNYKKKPNLVFGCGGDRDKSKRIAMGIIAKKYADKVYITDDNPRTEDANKIRLSILKGCPGAKIVNSRKIAIKNAIEELQSKDILIIAGKGHEKYQIIDNKKILFDDKAIANNCINKKNNKINKIIFSKYDIKINSRDIKKGDIFLALKGKKDHGFNYIEDAIRNGAKFVISEKRFPKYHDKVLLVDNCIETLKFIGKIKRSNYKGKIIGITGSAGKTSTKEQLNFFLSKVLKTYSSIKSYNNYLGVNLSLANLDLASSVAIFEIGTNNFGEIEKLTSLIKPNISIITNIGPSHLKNLKSEKNVALEKANIFNIKYNDQLELIIIPHEYYIKKYIKNILKKNINQKIITFGKNKNSNIYINNISKIQNQMYKINALVFKKKVKYNLKTTGEHHALNSLISLGIFNFLNLDFRKLISFAPYLPDLSGRGKTHYLNIYNKKIYLVDESYNANPISMKASLKYFGDYQTQNNGRKILILGEMLELGKRSRYFHYYIGKFINQKKFNQIILCGIRIKNLYNSFKDKKKIFYFNNLKNLNKHIIQNIENSDVIFAKCSNETLVNKFVDLIKRKN